MVLPGVGAFGACAQALRESGLEAPARDAIAAGVPFFGVCVGFQLLYESSVESPGATGLGVFSGTVDAVAGRGEAPADAVERAGARGDRRAAPCSRDWAHGPGSTSSTRSRRRSVRRPSPCATTADRWRPWRTAARCGVPSSTPRSRARRAWPCWPTSWPAQAAALMELMPAIDLRGGEAVRLTQGDFDREQRYGDPLGWPQRYVDAGAPLDPRGRPRRGAHRRVPRARRAEPDRAPGLATAGVRVQTGGGIRTEDDGGRPPRVRGDPGRAGHGRPRGARPGGPLRPALARAGGRRPRLPGRATTGWPRRWGTAGARVRAGR